MGMLCGADGTRTRDPRTASAVRYQLRYSPKEITTGTAVVRRPPYTRPAVIPDAGSAQWFAPVSASSNHWLVLRSGTIFPFTSTVGVPKRWSDRNPLM